MPGFASYGVHGVMVAVGKDTSLGLINLKVGETSETVEVQGTAPLVENTTDQLSETFDSKQVSDVPLGNTYDSFVLFSPGFRTAGSGAFQQQQRRGAFDQRPTRSLEQLSVGRAE